jgi:L-fucose mutarotase
MLKGIDPLLRGELLRALDEMGHGQKFALVDRNFPAFQSGTPVIDLGEVNATRATEAIMAVFPLDAFVDSPLERMGADSDLSEENEAQSGVRIAANKSAASRWEWKVIPRLEFYDAIREAALVVRCLEDAPYACFLFRKGVI